MNLNMIGAGASAAAAAVSGPLLALGNAADPSGLAAFLGPLGAVALMWYFLREEREERRRLTARAEASADAMAQFATKSVEALELNSSAQLALARVLGELRDLYGDDAGGKGGGAG
jgi:hypothetical protein